jgi:CRISPR-associated protein Cmr1
VGWTTLHLEVTTPLFNGGADPSGKDTHSGADGTGVRVPSLRGAMRFWLRALAGLAVGPDLPLLAAVEGKVFGNTEAASPVKLRVPSQPPLSSPGRPFFVQEAGRWVGYLLGQGLAPLKEGRPYVSRPYVAPGQTFDLQLRLTGSQEVAAVAVASLWLLCAYGGLGARTRRGLGGLRILDATGPLPVPWDQASIRTPGLDHYRQLTRLWPEGPVAACVPYLGRLSPRRLDPRAAWSDRLPTYPVLSRTHTIAGTSGGRTFQRWDDVLVHAGKQLRWFRASRDHPEVRYHPKIKTPEWTEVVTGPGDHFGLGALGLPVVYKDRVVNADHGRGFNAEPPLRRASPLWLRPVGNDRTGWRLLSYAFLGEFLPSEGADAPAVHIWRGGQQGKPVTVTHDDVVERATKWITTMREDRSFVREQR